MTCKSSFGDGPLCQLDLIIRFAKVQLRDKRCLAHLLQHFLHPGHIEWSLPGQVINPSEVDTKTCRHIRFPDRDHWRCPRAGRRLDVSFLKEPVDFYVDALPKGHRRVIWSLIDRVCLPCIDIKLYEVS